MIAVDLLGHCADYGRIEDICQSAGVPLLSDAAEALGASHAGRPAGSFGTAAILSFNGNKVISTSGGGALLTDDERFAERVRYLSTQARQPVAHYEHTEIGYNYRLSNVSGRTWPRSVGAAGRDDRATSAVARGLQRDLR